MKSRVWLLVIVLALAAPAFAADEDAAAGQLIDVYRATGNARAHQLALELERSDQLLAQLDFESAALIAAGHAPLARIDAAYDAAVAERRGALESALDLMFPIAARLPSGSLLAPENPLCRGTASNLGLYAPGEFKKRIGGGVYLTEPFDPHRDVLLVVHGINGSPQDFAGFIPSIDRARYQVWMAYYPTGEKIPAMAAFVRDALATELARHPAKRVFAICHSLGGLVFRTMLARGGFPGPLAAVTFVSTPHRGVRFAPMSAVRVACRWLWRFLPAEIDDLLEASDYLKLLNAAPAPAVRVHTAGGDSWRSTKARLVGPLIPGVDDGLVPQESTPLAGSLSYQLFHEDHYTILSSPELQRAFAGWLASDDAATR